MAKNPIVIHIKIPSKVVTQIDELVLRDPKINTRIDFIRYAILQTIQNEMETT